MNIAEKMRELLSTHKGKFRGRLVPLSQECEQDWTENFAICAGFYVEPEIGDDDLYRTFNRDDFMSDFREFVRDYFKSDPTVTVDFHSGSQEIEVFRVVKKGSAE